MPAAATKPRFTLETAIALANECHEGVPDLQGQPYIGHPTRVMEMFSTDDERIVAILHDAIEDTWLTLEDLIELGCPKHLVDAIDAVSHRPDEPREEYLARLVRNPLALKIKWGDLSDNHEPLRAAWVREYLPAKAAHFMGKDTEVLTYLATHADKDPKTRHMVEPFLKLLDQWNPIKAVTVRAGLGRTGIVIG